MTSLLILVLLILINGAFSLAEAALISARKARLQGLADDGDRSAQTALALATDPSVFLSTVQIGITLVGIMTGAIGNATLAAQLTPFFERFPALAPYSEGLSLAIVVLIVAYFSLVIGELAPKRLALHRPEQLAILVARPMHLLARLAHPIVRLLSLSTSLVLSLLGVRSSAEPPVTEDEFKVLIQQGTDAGVFDSAEQEIFRRTLRLGDRTVATIMTPRPDVVWLDLGDDPTENLHKIMSTPFANYPVANGALDDLRGIVNTRGLLTAALRGETPSLPDAVSKPLLVPDTTPALHLLELFRKENNRMAIVLDEYGGVLGLVTLDDVLHAIVGDMPDVGQPVEQRAEQRPDGSWLFDGMQPVDELRELLDLDELPGAGDYVTVAGFVLRQLGRIPAKGDHFVWDSWRFEVVKMDDLRIEEVAVRACDPPSNQGGECD